jgi:lipoprotein-releasing system ATP-binding protein
VLLEEPSRGMGDARRTALRGSAIGFASRFHHQIQAFAALEGGVRRCSRGARTQ